MGAPAPAGERARREHLAAALRRALGEEAFAAASDAGRGLTEADAVADAGIVAEAVGQPQAEPEPAPQAVDDGLTSREREVLRLIVEGRADREIGEALGISPRTAMRHAANIYAKLGVGTRAEATTVARRDRLV